jgi:UDP-GlcNAc3NAcA epimerase
MIKILNIIGARPQIIKSAAISRAVRTHFKNEINDIILHTGQHYDTNMSEVFFQEMQIPSPNYNLNIGSAGHGVQTGEMIIKIEEIILKEKPDCVVVYGDTNSTLAASIASSKIHFPVVHIEAGLRSFNKSMPEEINRIMCDHVSTLLFSPTLTGINNLVNEGFKTDIKPKFTIDNSGVFHSGDVMFDNSIYFSGIAESKSNVLNDNHIEKDNFILVTIHRNNNTDIPERLESIFKSIYEISKDNNRNVIIPLHPRTAKVLQKNITPELYQRIINNKLIKIIEPVSFFDMIILEKYAKMILTDSGGVQKEAYFFGKPCLILRTETEWTELVDVGAAKICDADNSIIRTAYEYFNNNNNINFEPIFGDGKAAEFICKEIINNFE